MNKQKRKARASIPSATNGNDSDGSDYEVEWHVKPTPPKVNKAELYPLPPQVTKNLQKPARGARKVSTSSESDVETGEGLPTLTTEQINGILETIKNNKRFVLIVKNVNFSTAKEEIWQHFDQAGRVKGVRIPKHRSSGFAFVEMENPDGFQKAFLLDGSYLDGRKISVNLSESGSKKSATRIQLLEKKNAEILKLRKKNRKNVAAEEITLVPDPTLLQKKVPPPDKYLDKPKRKQLTKKERKEQKQKTSLRAKFKNLEKKGIKA
ncbi:uncharacterized protein LOC126565245 [Anopheles maculipalpis]|uniref:uncharacterized protein LOC126565245 n=1 Tax=Anopheles maculipalpis TaxID=1496333 RepID=UPI00215926D7|nr:uncharacterized protein LOC126565245 [Anopheles maculipalpis]